VSQTSASIARHCGSGSNDQGVATTAEYVLLVGVAILIFLALAGAMAAFSATARDDATAIAAYRVASAISSAACDAAGSGDASACLSIDLPELICGMPYLAYPEGHDILICVSSGPTMLEYRAPVPLQAYDVSLAGFITGPPAGHVVVYDAATRTVTIA
jgi:hypothetical protein